VRFRKQQHYVRGVAYAMSMAKGESVFFFSHDMLITPLTIATLLEMAAMFPGAGVVRPASGHMDGSVCATLPPLAIRTLADAWSFSRLMHRYYGTTANLEPMLIGDAMLIRRDVIERVGVFDPQYFGFMGDVDYGLRVQHAGYELLTSRGAWLHHFGKGHIRDSQERGRVTPPEMGLPLLHNAYAQFRAKWNESLPEKYEQLDVPTIYKLRQRGPINGQIYQPPMVPTDDIAKIM
jgi:hypothetical protein